MGTKAPPAGREDAAEGARRVSRLVGAVIAVALAAVFVFCHGCHAGDHDDELVIRWTDDG